MAKTEERARFLVRHLRIPPRTLVALAASVLAACASGPPENADPVIAAKEKRDAQMIKKMQSYVGWNIGSFMSDWGMTPTATTPVADGNVYQFDKLQTESKCSWAIRTNSMGNIVQWSMRGNACPNADGP